MAIIKKYNPKQIYLSDRLKGKFESILEYSLTVIESPIGYGKTTTLSEYLKRSDNKYMWFNIDNDDKEQFFSDFCAKVEGINEDVAAQMRAIGYPTDEHESSKLANVMMQLNFSKNTILVLDNYDYIADDCPLPRAVFCFFPSFFQSAEFHPRRHFGLALGLSAASYEPVAARLPRLQERNVTAFFLSPLAFASAANCSSVLPVLNSTITRINSPKRARPSPAAHTSKSASSKTRRGPSCPSYAATSSALR